MKQYCQEAKNTPNITNPPNEELNIEKLFHQLKDEGIPAISNVKGKDVVFVIGNTGAGKSTLIDFLLGANIQVGRHEVTGWPIMLVDNAEKKYAEIGHDIGIGSSCTLYPRVFDPKEFSNEAIDFCFCDCPGFLDNRGGHVRLFASLTMELAVKSAARRRAVMVVIDWNEFRVVRGKLLSELHLILHELFHDINQLEAEGAVQFLVTKCDCLLTNEAKELADNPAYFQNQIKACLGYIKANPEKYNGVNPEELAKEKHMLEFMSTRTYGVDLFSTTSKQEILNRLNNNRHDIPMTAFVFSKCVPERVALNQHIEHEVMAFRSMLRKRAEISQAIRDSQFRVELIQRHIQENEEEKCHLNGLVADLWHRIEETRVTRVELEQKTFGEGEFKQVLQKKQASFESEIARLEAENKANSTKETKLKAEYQQLEQQYRNQKQNIEKEIAELKAENERIETSADVEICKALECSVNCRFWQMTPGSRSYGISWRATDDESFKDYIRQYPGESIYLPLFDVQEECDTRKGNFIGPRTFDKWSGVYSNTFKGDYLESCKPIVKIRTCKKHMPNTKKILRENKIAIEERKNRMHQLDKQCQQDQSYIHQGITSQQQLIAQFKERADIVKDSKLQVLELMSANEQQIRAEKDQHAAKVREVELQLQSYQNNLDDTFKTSLNDITRGIERDKATIDQVSKELVELKSKHGEIKNALAQSVSKYLVIQELIGKIEVSFAQAYMREEFETGLNSIVIENTVGSDVEQKSVEIEPTTMTTGLATTGMFSPSLRKNIATQQASSMQTFSTRTSFLHK